MISGCSWLCSERDASRQGTAAPASDVDKAPAKTLRVYAPGTPRIVSKDRSIGLVVGVSNTPIGFVRIAGCVSERRG